jgi:hypothetical protein
VVGTTEVPLFSEINGLAQGEGEISPLKCKGYFEGPPHPDRPRYGSPASILMRTIPMYGVAGAAAAAPALVPQQLGVTAPHPHGSRSSLVGPASSRL